MSIADYMGAMKATNLQDFMDQLVRRAMLDDEGVGVMDSERFERMVERVSSRVCSIIRRQRKVLHAEMDGVLEDNAADGDARTVEHLTRVFDDLKLLLL